MSGVKLFSSWADIAPLYCIVVVGLVVVVVVVVVVREVWSVSASGRRV